MSWSKILVDVVVEFAKRIDFTKIFQGDKMLFVTLGPSGVGKTRFKQSLTGSFEELDSSLVRTVSNEAVTVRIAEKEAILVDTPGHDLLKEVKDQAARKAATRSEYGLIFLCAYGYLESEVISKPEISNEKISNSWLLSQKNSELAFFESEVEKAVIRGAPKIVLVVVNKADIWEDDWEIVKSYYLNSKFAQQLADNNITLEIVPYCARPQKFWGLELPAMKLDNDEAKEMRSEFSGVFVQFFK